MRSILTATVLGPCLLALAQDDGVRPTPPPALREAPPARPKAAKSASPLPPNADTEITYTKTVELALGDSIARAAQVLTPGTRSRGWPRCPLPTSNRPASWSRSRRSPGRSSG